jgi:hypothetical protein
MCLAGPSVAKAGSATPRTRAALRATPAVKRSAHWSERVQTSSAAGWAVILATVFAAMLANSLVLSFSHLRLIVAVIGVSAVCTVCLAVGWTLEPDRLGRWCVWSLAASAVSASPVVVW